MYDKDPIYTVPHPHGNIIAFSRQKALPACEFYINWCQISIMSIGQTQISNGPLDEKKCPLDITVSIGRIEFECPLDIQMSIRPLDEQKGPMDVQIMSSGHSNVHWTYCRGIGHVWCKRGHILPVK